MWMKPGKVSPDRSSRRAFIGGSDARVIVGDDEGALLRLWREKRGEVEPEDLSGNLAVQLGLATENLNRRSYRPRGESCHRRANVAAAPDLAVDGGDARRSGRRSEVFEAKFMLPWQFSEEAAAQKHAAQLHIICLWWRREVRPCR